MRGDSYLCVKVWKEESEISEGKLRQKLSKLCHEGCDVACAFSVM